MAKKLTYEEARKAFNDRGYTLLSTEYINAQTKMDYLCNEHGKQSITYNNLQQGKGCQQCGYIKTAKNKRVSIEVVQSAFKARGYELLSDNYENNEQNLDYICPEHGRQSMSYGNLMAGKGCIECGGTAKLKYEDVKKEFEKRGYILISTEYLNSARSKLDFLCPIHGLGSISHNNLMKGKGCKPCGVSMRTGDKNVSWKGGITKLASAIRDYIEPCVSKCIANADYTCEITGIRGYALEVHHTYAFNSILQDTITSLGINVRQNIGEYTSDELINIKDKFAEIHNSHKLLVLSKEIHKLFHDIYGRGNNTPEQFSEFKARYDSGEFTELLSKTA